jgi:hypothetical protein
MLYVPAACPCCLSLLHYCSVSPCWWHARDYGAVPVLAPCPSTCFMSTLHLHAACTHCMSLSHVHAASPCFMSILHVHAAFTILRVHASCPCHISTLHVPAVCATSSFCMSILHVHTACPCCTSLLHVLAAWRSCLSILLLHAVCLCCIYMQHWLAACPCCMSTLHAYVNFSCPCCMSLNLEPEANVFEFGTWGQSNRRFLGGKCELSYNFSPWWRKFQLTLKVAT